MGIGALIGGAASGIGSLIGAGASSKASQQQTAMQEQALALQQQQYQNSLNMLAPYRAYGQQELGQLQGQLPQLTKAFNPTMAQLEQTPGYQFTLGQGLESTQNGYAAQGLASSGAALKGAANYASGLAANTYQQQFNNYWANNQNAFNMLNSGVNTGLAGAGQSANTSTNYANNASNTLSNIGSAQAQGTLGSASALSGGLSGLGNSIMMYNMLGNMQGGGNNFMQNSGLSNSDLLSGYGAGAAAGLSYNPLTGAMG